MAIVCRQGTDDTAEGPGHCSHQLAYRPDIIWYRLPHAPNPRRPTGTRRARADFARIPPCEGFDVRHCIEFRQYEDEFRARDSAQPTDRACNGSKRENVVGRRRHSARGRRSIQHVWSRAAIGNQDIARDEPACRPRQVRHGRRAREPFDAHQPCHSAVENRVTRG